MSATGKRGADKLNVIGVATVGVCGAVLTYVSIILLEAFYMNETSAIERQREFEKSNSLRNTAKAAALGHIDGSDGKTIAIDRAMALIVRDAAQDPSNLVPAVGASTVSTTLAIYEHNPPDVAGAAPPAAPAGAGSGSASGSAAGSGSGSASGADAGSGSGSGSGTASGAAAGSGAATGAAAGSGAASGSAATPPTPPAPPAEKPTTPATPPATKPPVAKPPATKPPAAKPPAAKPATSTKPPAATPATTPAGGNAP